MALEWEAPASCPSGEAVRARAEQRLGRPLAIDPDAEVAAIARVEGLRLELSVASPSGTTTRTMTATSCDALADVTALVIALGIDAQAAATETRPLPPPPDDRTPQVDEGESPLPVAPARGDPPATPPKRPRITGFVAIGAGIQGGVLPAAGGTFEGWLGIRGRLWSVALGTGHAFAERGRVTNVPAARLELQQTWAAIEACAEPRLGARIVLPVCGGADAGVVTGRGSGFPGAALARQPWAALHVGSGIGVRLHRVIALVARADLLVSLRRPAFSLGPDVEFHRVDAVGGRGSLRLVVDFP